MKAVKDADRFSMDLSVIDVLVPRDSFYKIDGPRSLWGRKPAFLGSMVAKL